MSPVGCFNRPVNTEKFINQIEKGREKYEGAVFVCDDCGCVLIPKEQLTEEFYCKIQQIEEQEDIWYDCIDRKKWSTFDTICLKKYLNRE